MSREQDYWVEDQLDGVPPRWPVVDGSGESSHVIASCPDRDDAERIVAALAASQRPEQAADEIERLKAELIDQWESNHSEHCTNVDIFHDKKPTHSYGCLWPIPGCLSVDEVRAALAQPAGGEGAEPCGCGDQKISHEPGPCTIHGCECPGYKPYSEMPDW